MQTTEAPRQPTWDPPAARRVKKGKTVDSPQVEQITRLEILAKSSPRMHGQMQLAAQAATSSRMSVQRRVADMIDDSPRLAAQRQVLGNTFGAGAQQKDMNAPVQLEVARHEEASPIANDTNLPNTLKNGLESLPGMSLDNVRVHYNSSNPAQLNALAYAHGADVHVAPGQEQHLPHKAWHVVQQAQGRVQSTIQTQDGVPINDDQSLEREADVMGGKSASIGAALEASLKSQPNGRTGSRRYEKRTDIMTSTAQRMALSGRENVIQRYDIFPGQYKKIIADLMSQDMVAELIRAAVTAGDVTIQQNNTDDTYWDRKKRTIFVSHKKNNAQAKAAILFELNNAVNPHTHTDTIESRLSVLSERQVVLTGPDFFRVAQEMEKDEFESLKNYNRQVESSGATGKELEVLQDKYKAILDVNGELDYDLFVEQNIASGHTMELAELQYENYTGGQGLAEIMPLRLRQPTIYAQYMKGKITSGRQAEKVAKTLEEEKAKNLDTTTPALWDH